MPTNSLANLERALLEGKANRRGRSPASDGPQMCGDIDMRISRDGTWHYLGTPIARKRLVKLFASVLRRDESGDFWLVTPAEMCRIRVDDAPFLAVEMAAAGTGRNRTLEFRTNLDEKVIAGRAHPIRVETDPDTGEPAPYIRVRDGLDALIARAVFYDLVELGEERQSPEGVTLGVWSDGVFFELGSLQDA